MKLIFRDAESFTKLFYGKKSKKVFAENSEDKKQTVPSVRDNDICKNGVCIIATGALNSHNAETVGMRMTVNEVCNASTVVGVNNAVTGAVAEWAGFKFRVKTGHIGIKKRF